MAQVMSGEDRGSGTVDPALTDRGAIRGGPRHVVIGDCDAGHPVGAARIDVESSESVGVGAVAHAHPGSVLGDLIGSALGARPARGRRQLRPDAHYHVALRRVMEEPVAGCRGPSAAEDHVDEALAGVHLVQPVGDCLGRSVPGAVGSGSTPRTALLRS